MSGEIKINISPEDIQRAVVQAVVDSSIGETLNRVISDILNQKIEGTYANGYKRSSILEDAVRKEVELIIAKFIAAEVSERKSQITEFIALKITDDVVNKWCEAGWQNFMTLLEKHKEN